MNRSFLRSLRARLIIGAAIWIAIGVSAAGIFIAALFRQFATDMVDGQLRKHLEELVALIDVDAEGFPHLYRSLSDPLFSQIGSGFSWQVSRSGKSLIKSLSASADELPVPTDALDTHEVRKLTLEGQHGPMIVFERMFLPEGGTPTPLRIQLGAETAVVDRMLPTFKIPLTFSLALLAFALIMAAALQVSFGLQPMSRLRRALGAIGSGSAAKLPGDFPSEVQPLVDDLNNLIEINGQMVLRARTQAGNLAHALKTPLAILTDEAHRLESRSQEESAAVILQQSQRMQRQIDYQIARARAAASRSVPGVVAPVLPTVSNIITAMKRLYDTKKLRIDVDVDARCAALCDPMDLSEMLANLIDNACKWAAETVAIRGHTDESGNQVVIAVEDDGPGLPAEAMDVVFRIGERLDEQVPGSGLGLPIVRDLAQLYGGEIRLENSIKGGLRALLKLPRARTEPGPARRVGISPPA
jgi:signal transduction histidine kinase